MAEEEDKGGWTEIEVSDQPTDSKEEIEIETPVSEDMSPAAEVIEAVQGEEEDQEKDAPELEGIETKGAEKRIRQLIKQRKERDEELDKARAELNQLRYQMSEVGKLKFDYDDALASAKEGEISSRLENARTKFKDAYEAGNKDGVLEAQEELSEAKTDLKLLDQQKGWIKQQAEEYSNEQQRRKTQYENSETASIDPLAQEWAEKNKFRWFSRDNLPDSWKEEN